MGYFRKGLFVATGGASGLFVKANSKKDRTARATEKIAKAVGSQAPSGVLSGGGVVPAPGVTPAPLTSDVEPESQPGFGAALRGAWREGMAESGVTGFRDAIRQGAAEGAAKFDAKKAAKDTAKG